MSEIDEEWRTKWIWVSFRWHISEETIKKKSERGGGRKRRGKKIHMWIASSSTLALLLVNLEAFPLLHYSNATSCFWPLPFTSCCCCLTDSCLLVLNSTTLDTNPLSLLAFQGVGLSPKGWLNKQDQTCTASKRTTHFTGMSPTPPPCLFLCGA